MNILGSTGLVVSRIGLGLAALGRPAYITSGRDRDLGDDRSVEAMERRCYAMLDAAWSSGIRYVDAARSYGLAEQFLASWLHMRQLPEDAIVIGSKWGYEYVGGWRMDAPVHEVKDLSVDALRKQHAESRALLGSRLRLYQIHSATLESGVLEDRAVIGELAGLRSRGLAIGLTVTGPNQAETIRHAMTIAVDGVDLFQTVQATWNLLETSAAPALADAHARGWGVIVKEALANGRLTDANGRPGDAGLVRTLNAAAAALGCTVDQLALAFVLEQPWTDMVLSGAATTEQLQSHVGALEIALAAETRAMLAAIAEPPARYWATRSSLPWN